MQNHSRIESIPSVSSFIYNNNTVTSKIELLKVHNDIQFGQGLVDSSTKPKINDIEVDMLPASIVVPLLELSKKFQVEYTEYMEATQTPDATTIVPVTQKRRLTGPGHEFFPERLLAIKEYHAMLDNVITVEKETDEDEIIDGKTQKKKIKIPYRIYFPGHLVAGENFIFMYKMTRLCVENLILAVPPDATLKDINDDPLSCLRDDFWTYLFGLPSGKFVYVPIDILKDLIPKYTKITNIRYDNNRKKSGDRIVPALPPHEFKDRISRLAENPDQAIEAVALKKTFPKNINNSNNNSNVEVDQQLSTKTKTFNPSPAPILATKEPQNTKCNYICYYIFIFK